MSYSINSGVKIFDIIEILGKNPKSRKELSENLTLKSKTTKLETISKYLRTLRITGFEIISKKSHPYEILKTPFKITLNKAEQEGLYVILKNGEGLFDEKFNPFKYKLENLIENAKISYEKGDIYNNKTLKNLRKLNEFIFDNEIQLKLITDKNKINVLIKRIKYKKNGIFLSFYNSKTKKIENLNLNEIQKIKSVDKNIPSIFEIKETTTFKIKGKLKQNYILREGESARFEDNEIFVSNHLEEKEELFSRLLKYGKNCEIISPKSDRKKFIELLKSTLNHYMSM